MGWGHESLIQELKRLHKEQIDSEYLHLTFSEEELCTIISSLGCIIVDQIESYGRRYRLPVMKGYKQYTDEALHGFWKAGYGHEALLYELKKIQKKYGIHTHILNKNNEKQNETYEKNEDEQKPKSLKENIKGFLDYLNK